MAVNTARVCFINIGGNLKCKFKATKGFTYQGKDYFKGDSIEVEDKDVAGLKQYGRISEGAVKVKEAPENKAKG